MSSVLFDVTGGVATITLNRPESFNALDMDLGQNLSRKIEACFAPEIRAVIITGAGKAFCSGGDLRAMAAAGSDNLTGFLGDLTKLLHRFITDIRLVPKPVIAAINGSLGGAGFSLALACDLRYAVNNARFKQAYTSVGLCPDGGFTAFLPAMVGLSKASEILLLDPVLDAQQAKELGIVHDVFSPEDFLPNTTKIAEKLAAGATRSYAMAKNLLNQSLLPHLEKQLEMERQGIIASSNVRDAREGIQAFIEKRTPVYTGN